MAITGTGTETDPYLVFTAEELRACLESNSSGEYPGEYIQLANDIDKVGDKLNGTVITSQKCLNGDNHKIRNLYVNQRLFSIKNVPVTFKNIHFENIDVLTYGTIGILIYVEERSFTTINIHTCTFHVHLAELGQGENTLFHFYDTSQSNSTMLFQQCEFMFFIDKKSNVSGAYFTGFDRTSQYPIYPQVNIGIKQSRIVFDYSNFLTTQQQANRMHLVGNVIGEREASSDAGLKQTYLMIKGNDKDYSICSDNGLCFTSNQDIRLNHVYFFANDNVKSSLLSHTYSNMSTDLSSKTYATKCIVSTLLTQNQEESGSQGVYYLTYDQLKDPNYLNSIYWYVNKEGE